MKKIYGIICFLALTFVGCKNDAIDIDKVATPEPFKTLSVTVSTTSAYEKYGLVDYQNYLGSNPGSYVGVTSLLYNSNGMLVDSVSSYSRTFNNISQSFGNLLSGEYTLITFETIVDASNGYKSNNWRLIDINKLETVQIHNEKYDRVDWQYSIGVSTNNIVINVSSDSQVSASPQPIGVLLDLGYENFAQSGYIWLGFELKNTASGYYLNPALSVTERYKYDDGYNAQNTWSSRGYFYESSGLPSSDSKKFYMLESGNIPYCFGATDELNESGGFSFHALPSDNAYFNFVDGEYYKAYAYYKGFGDDLATFVGSQSEFTSWRTKLLSAIADTPLYEEPYIVWGASASTVQAFMSSYEAFYDSPQEVRENLYGLTYYGKYKEAQIRYFFNTAVGDLSFVNVFWKPGVTSTYEVSSFLSNKGYSYEGSEDGVEYFSKEDINTGVKVLVNNSGYIVAQYYQLVSEEKPSQLFSLPYMQWGGSVSDVQAYMSSYSPGNNTAEQVDEYYRLWYYGKDSEIQIHYFFNNADGDLSFVNVFFAPEEAYDNIFDQLVKFGFSFVEYNQDDAIYWYWSSNYSTWAAVLENSSGYKYIQFFGGTSSNSRSRQMSVKKQTVEIKGSGSLSRKGTVKRFKGYDNLDVSQSIKM